MHNCKSVRESYTEAKLTQEDGFVVMDYNIGNQYYLRTDPKTENTK